MPCTLEASLASASVIWAGVMVLSSAADLRSPAAATGGGTGTSPSLLLSPPPQAVSAMAAATRMLRG